LPETTGWISQRVEGSGLDLDVSSSGAVRYSIEKQHPEAMIEVFAALVDPSRRRILDGLGERDGMLVGESAMTQDAPCSACGNRSLRGHSRYDRALAAVGTVPAAPSFGCVDSCARTGKCSRRTFAEQGGGRTSAYARRTPLLTGILEPIGLALAGRVGACLDYDLRPRVEDGTS
jgi:hypothetical protein